MNVDIAPKQNSILKKVSVELPILPALFRLPETAPNLSHLVYVLATFALSMINQGVLRLAGPTAVIGPAFAYGELIQSLGRNVGNSNR